MTPTYNCAWSSIYSVSAFQTELNSEFLRKNQDEMVIISFCFLKEASLQTRTQNFCCLEHTLQLTQTQQPMTKNTVVKWPKAKASSYAASSKASRSALPVNNPNERNLGWWEKALCDSEHINFKMCWRWKSLYISLPEARHCKALKDLFNLAQVLHRQSHSHWKNDLAKTAPKSNNVRMYLAAPAQEEKFA